MEHKAEAGRQHRVEAPGDHAPVVDRIGACPVLNGPQLRDVGFLGVVDPFAQGIEEDVRRQTAGEHHGAPEPEAVLGLFIGAAQNDVPDFGKGQVKADQKHAQSDHQIVGAEGVSQEEPDRRQHVGGPRGIDHKKHAQDQNTGQRDHRSGRIQLSFHRFVVHFDASSFCTML